jgi:hypothetical protein
MSGSGWTDIVGAVGGGIGGAAGVAGAVIATLAKRDSRQSANASERSAKASERSADEAAALNRLEHNREHERFRPKAPAKIDAKLEDGSLFGRITVPHDYRVEATGLYSTSASHTIAMPPLLRANQPHRFHIEHWPPGATELKTREILFRFWPPAAEDGGDGESWACACGRPVGQGAGGPGHWEWRVPVMYVSPLDSIW